MRERPILFSAPMVRALLDGSKTQTRRIVKPTPVADQSFVGGFYIPSTKRTEGSRLSVEAPYVGLACPYGKTDDRLWVRETWMDLQGTGVEATTGSNARCAYRADTPPGSHGDEMRKEYGLKWTPAIHMFRWASRIALEITGVRVERLRNISEADSKAEGAMPSIVGQDLDHIRYRAGYQSLWESINGVGSWDADPFVWVVEFKRITP